MSDINFLRIEHMFDVIDYSGHNSYEFQVDGQPAPLSQNLKEPPSPFVEVYCHFLKTSSLIRLYFNIFTYPLKIT